AAVRFRLFSLEVLQAAELTLKADRQHRKAVTIEGERGAIYDRRGKVLAMNMEVPSVFGVPASAGNPSRVARDLGRLLHVQASEIEKKLRQERDDVWIARKLEPVKGRRLERMASKGIGVVLDRRRCCSRRRLF